MNNQARCIAHEIKNQISICELYSQIIKKHLEKDNIKNPSIDNALICITRALKIMTNNLVDLKTLDNLCLKKCNLSDVLKECINLSTVYVQDKNIEILLSIIDNKEVFIDENKFLACLINIVKNAIEAMDKKGEIRIIQSVEGNNAIIKISNNGAPISDTEHIFDEGFTTKKSGSGLGLAICKEYLKEQNAELKLSKSTKDLTEFEITIPIS